MDEKTTKDNVMPDEKPKLNIEEVLNKYSLEELKQSVCENLLLGNFDKDKNYKILDILYPELINLKKVIEKNTNDCYTAVSVINNIKLNFEVKFKAIEETNKMSATLVLHEKFVVGGIYESTLSTTLQTLSGDNTVEFLAEVRKVFHLYNKDEDDQQDLLENYVSPPIELVGELLKKSEMLDAYKILWQEFDKNYINDLFNVLKKTKNGQEVIKKFLQTVKSYDLSTIKQEKNRVMKAIFDKVLDEEIAKHSIENDQLDEIVIIRHNYTENIEKKLNEKLQEQIAMLKPEKIKTVEKPKLEVKQQKPQETKSSAPKTQSGGGGAPSKSAPAPEKSSSQPKKEDTKAPVVGSVPQIKPEQIKTPKIETKKKPLNAPVNEENLSEDILLRSLEAVKKVKQVNQEDMNRASAANQHKQPENDFTK